MRYVAQRGPSRVRGMSSMTLLERSNQITSKEFKRSRERPSKKQVRAWEYNMTGHAASCVEKYFGLSGFDASSLKHVAHPCIDDHQLR